MLNVDQLVEAFRPAVRTALARALQIELDALPLLALSSAEAGGLVAPFQDAEAPKGAASNGTGAGARRDATSGPAPNGSAKRPGDRHRAGSGPTRAASAQPRQWPRSALGADAGACGVQSCPAGAHHQVFLGDAHRQAS